MRTVRTVGTVECAHEMRVAFSCRLPRRALKNKWRNVTVAVGPTAAA